jgi:hypothetical protein
MRHPQSAEDGKPPVGRYYRLADPIDRQPDPGPVIEPLTYRKAMVARMLGVGERTIERLRSAGKFPRPDAHAGKCPLWTRETLTRWIAQGGGRI